MGDGRLTDEAARVERDGSAPGWAEGYSIADLRRITTLFNRHDEGLLHGAFDRYRDRDAANDLNNGWLKLGPRDAEGAPVWALVARVLDRKQPVRDFTGGLMTLMPGTLYCTRMAFADENAAESILGQLRAHAGAIAVECWQEHPRERALVARVPPTGVARESGGGPVAIREMRLAAVKIKESSAMRGVWISHDITDPPWACRADERYSPYPKQELAGLAQLPVELPQDAILALSSHPTVRNEQAYAPQHPSHATGDTWTALALRGFYDEPGRAEKPSQMDRRWKSKHEQDLDREPRDTPLRAALGADIEKILEVLPCDGFERIRLMRLAPGGALARHTDITDPDAGASEGEVVRVHIPLVSSEQCVFQSWGLDGSSSTVVMEVGSAYYADARKPHAVVNEGETERVDLVVDCIANAETVAMLRSVDRSTAASGAGRSAGRRSRRRTR